MTNYAAYAGTNHYSQFRRSARRYRMGGPGSGSFLYRYAPNTTFIYSRVDNFDVQRSGPLDLSQPVFGYFAGGGFAFGFNEHENLRVPVEMYEWYRDAGPGDEASFQLLDSDGLQTGKTRTIRVGTDLPAYDDLSPLDKFTWQHDLELQRAREAFQAAGDTSASRQALADARAVANAALIQSAQNFNWDAEYAALANSGLQGRELMEMRSLIAYQEAYAEIMVRGLLNLGAEITDVPADQARVQELMDQVFEEIAINRDVSAETIRDMYQEAQLTQGMTSHVFGFAGEYFGSQLGNYIVGNQDDLGEFVAASFINSIGADFGRFLAAGIGSGQPTLGITEAFEEVGDAFSADFTQRFRDGVVGGVSAFLTLELGEALGLEGFGAELFNTVGGTVISHFVDASVNSAQNLWSGVNAEEALTSGEILSNLPNALAGALGAFIGSKLGSLVIQPSTQAGIVLSGLGSVGGAALGMKFSGAFTSFFGGSKLLGVFAATGVGAFVGFVLGAFIGNLFGSRKPKIPTADAETVLNFDSGYYQLGAMSAQNGGNEDLVRDIATAARDTLNQLISTVVYDLEVAGNANVTSPTQVYGHTGGQLWVKLGSQSAAKQNVTSADEAVDKGVLWAIDRTEIVGGDLFMKRAIANSRADSVMALTGDLAVAGDYGDYLSNRSVIDDAIAAPYASLSQSDKTFYDTHKARFTRIMAKDSVPLSPADQDWYTHTQARQDRVDRIISDLSVSQFAAGWIITLQRAAELGLNEASHSDFHGGLGGLMDSLAIQSGREVRLEDTRLSLDGNTLNVDFGAVLDGSANLLRGGDLSEGTRVLKERYTNPVYGPEMARSIETVDGRQALVLRDDQYHHWTPSGHYPAGSVYLMGGDLDGGQRYTVKAGEQISFAMEAQNLRNDDARLYMYVHFYDAAGVKISHTSTRTANGQTSWGRVSKQVTAPTGAVEAEVSLILFGSMGADGAVPTQTAYAARRVERGARNAANDTCQTRNVGGLEKFQIAA